VPADYFGVCVKSPPIHHQVAGSMACRRRPCWASSSRITASVFVVENDDHLVGVLFRVVKSQAADREIDDS
jgi:hypothetical protein